MDSLAVLTKRGWSAKGSSEYSRQFAPRQGCTWTDKEDYDLIEQVKYGIPYVWIAEYHQRSLGGITSRLADPERAQAGHDRYAQGVPKPKRRNHVWARRGKYQKRLHKEYMGKKRYERITQQEKYND